MIAVEILCCKVRREESILGAARHIYVYCARSNLCHANTGTNILKAIAFHTKCDEDKGSQIFMVQGRAGLGWMKEMRCEWPNHESDFIWHFHQNVINSFSPIIREGFHEILRKNVDINLTPILTQSTLIRSTHSDIH